jgi:hypothetical protein
MNIQQTIANTKARLAKEEERRREYWDKVKIKKNKQWANHNKWHENNPTPYSIEGCEERGRVLYTTKEFDSLKFKFNELQECLSPEEVAKKKAIEQAKQNKISSIGSAYSSASSRSSSPAASRASSPVASAASSPVASGASSPVASSVISNGSMTPPLSVKERMKRFQKGGDSMANWTARLAAQRRINETRREGIRPIRIPNVKFNTSSPSTPISSPSTPTSPSSPMSVKNRIKFFENRRKSVGGKTRKNKSRKSKTKKSRRN